MTCFIKFAFLLLAATLHSQTSVVKDLDTLLKKYNSTDNHPGMTVRVIKGLDIIYSKSFGMSNLDYSVKNSDSTMYSIASISKQFTAAATWVLISQGKSRLDVDIYHNLKSFVGDFKEINSDMKMSFIVENDTLKTKDSFGDNFIPLIATSTNKFARLNAPNVTYDFNENEEADLILYFGGTPFYFKRANFISDENINLNEFSGKYYSEELDVFYSFNVVDNSLILNYKNNKNTRLFPVQYNEFGNNNRTLYRFSKNKSQLFLSCDGTVKDIEFNKVN